MESRRERTGFPDSTRFRALREYRPSPVYWWGSEQGGDRRTTEWSGREAIGILVTFVHSHDEEVSLESRQPVDGLGMCNIQQETWRGRVSAEHVAPARTLQLEGGHSVAANAEQLVARVFRSMVRKGVVEAVD
ncbi:hypothetical protein B0H16DRAFT_1449830 [Mycena metata]|uniref:Uncharacterized protein n=1 Tax=Mycena metata TaxID=1033252 RepID=A0AAD7NVB4_9AGAR|nr:hypothetical protein B0H16DRAFT_1449830 [Mycena metata]